MDGLIGRTIAVQMNIGDRKRVLTGRVIEAPLWQDDFPLRIEIEDPDGSSGFPILSVKREFLRELQSGYQFGCEFFLNCDTPKN